MSISRDEFDDEVDDSEFDFVDEEALAPTQPLLPARYHHCVRLYEVMKKQATQRTEGLVWEGSLLKTMVGELQLGNAHYTSITRALKSMGCMQQLRRGGGPQGSIWRLIKPPSPAAFRIADDSPTPVRTKAQATRKEQDQRIRDLSRRVHNLERVARAQGWPL
jgi:hypothetical protein